MGVLGLEKDGEEQILEFVKSFDILPLHGYPVTRIIHEIRDYSGLKNCKTC